MVPLCHSLFQFITKSCSFNPYCNSGRLVLFLSSFFRWGSWNTWKLNLLSISQLVKWSSWAWNPESQDLDLVLMTPLLWCLLESILVFSLLFLLFYILLVEPSYEFALVEFLQSLFLTKLKLLPSFFVTLFLGGLIFWRMKNLCI